MHRLARIAVALAFVAGSLVLPQVRVAACSCAMLGGPADIIRDAEVAFIGTVTATAPGGAAADGFGPLVRYAFEVDRASVAVPSTIEVRALDDGGGASCGFTFGIGERWFVTAHGMDGQLHTGLCNGNARTDALAEAELAKVTERLPVLPDPVDSTATAAEGSPLDPFLPWAALAAAIVAVGALMWVAFRRGGVGSAS